MKVTVQQQPSVRWYELDAVCRSLTQAIATADAAGVGWLSHRLLALKQDVVEERERA